MAELLGDHLGMRLQPKLIHKFRAGDIRHCYADISKIKRRLGFKPRVNLKTGIRDLIDWVRNQKGIDRVDTAFAELHKRGLVK